MIKRILLCPSAYFPAFGGVEELTRKLAREYKKRGLDVYIISSKPPKSKTHELVDGIPVWRFNFFTPAKRVYNLIRFFIFFPYELIKLIILVKKIDPQLIHIQCNGNNIFYFEKIKKILKIPLIDTLQGEIHGDDFKLYQTSPFAIKNLKNILKCADFVTACSKIALEAANSFFNVKNKSQVVFNGIDLSEIKRSHHKLAKKQNYIFALGRLTQNKGFDLLVKAFHKFQQKHPDINLVIGGDGPLKESLEKFIKKNSLEKKVLLPGKLSRVEVSSYLSGSLFVVIPSLYEAFGIVALEGLAAGKAILATKYGGPAEFITGKIGRIFDPKDQKDFVSSLEWMSKNHQKLEKNSKKLVHYFDWKNIAAEYIKIYERVLRNG